MSFTSFCQKINKIKWDDLIFPRWKFPQRKRHQANGNEWQQKRRRKKCRDMNHEAKVAVNSLPCIGNLQFLRKLRAIYAASENTDVLSTVPLGTFCTSFHFTRRLSHTTLSNAPLAWITLSISGAKYVMSHLLFLHYSWLLLWNGFTFALELQKEWKLNYFYSRAKLIDYCFLTETESDFFCHRP